RIEAMAAAVVPEAAEDFAVHADVELDLVGGLRGNAAGHGAPIVPRVFHGSYRKMHTIANGSIRSGYIYDNHSWEQWERDVPVNADEFPKTPPAPPEEPGWAPPDPIDAASVDL